MINAAKKKESVSGDSLIVHEQRERVRWVQSYHRHQHHRCGRLSYKNAVMFLLCYRLCNPFRGDISRSSRCSMRSVCSLYVCPALPCLPLPSFNFCIPIIRWMKCYRDRNFFRSYEFFFFALVVALLFLFLTYVYIKSVAAKSKRCHEQIWICWGRKVGMENGVTRQWE